MDLPEKLDILAFGAHPDDVEAGAGGLLLRARREGLKTGLVVLTKGESGSYGTPERRAQEAQEAAAVLEVSFFTILDFADAALPCDYASAVKLAGFIRRHRPALVLTMYPDDRHPDHKHTALNVERAVFLAARKTLDEQPPCWIDRVLYFCLDIKNVQPPNLVIDITDVYGDKQKALQAHASQAPLLQPLDFVARFYGAMIGRPYGEGFITRGPLTVRTIDALI